MAGSGLFRLYVGSLGKEVSEEDILRLFETHDLSAPLSVVIKPAGYAFIECPDQLTFDKAIDSLNGLNFMGSVMQVEPSSASRHRRTNRIQIRNVPSHVSQEDVEQLVRTFGQVQRCDIISTSSDDVSVNVCYESPDQAQQAVEQLKDYEFKGSLLRPEYARNRNGARNSGNNNNTNSRGSGYPLRILVPSEYVGAIIGKQGATIRRITSVCKARIDVHRENTAGLMEKVVSIYGQPDNCTNACQQIMEVIQAEAAANQRQEVPLKTLADDRYCGRIIGKEGKIIKKLREETESKISVSNVQEIPAMYPDRVITIRGSPENVTKAERAISNKLRECYEKEMSVPMHHHMMLPPPMNMGSMRGGGGGGSGMYNPSMGGGSYSGNMGGGGGGGSGSGSYYSGGGGGGGMYGQGASNMGSGPQQSSPQPPKDDLIIMVPNSAVGALIGTGGSYIKQIIRDSNAYVTIEPKREDETNPAAERTVTIKGGQDAKWKASYMVFEKLHKEGFSGCDDMRLRTGMKVPKSMVGRVIGKRGNNVRELQRMSGAMVKVPEDQQNQGDEVVVEMYGNFLQTNMAQNKLRSFCLSGNQGPNGSNGSGGGAGSMGHDHGGSRPSMGSRM